MKPSSPPTRPAASRLALAGALLGVALQAHAAFEGPATLVLRDVPTRLALTTVARLADLDVVTSSALQDARTSLAVTLPLRAAFDRIVQDAGAAVRMEPGGLRVVARACTLARPVVSLRVPGDWRRASFDFEGVQRGPLLDILTSQAGAPTPASTLPVAVVGVRTGQVEVRQLLRALQVAEGLEPAFASRGPFDLQARDSADCPAARRQTQAAAIDRGARPLSAWPLDRLRMVGYLQWGDAMPLALVLTPNDRLETVRVGDVLTADGARVGAIYGDGVHLAAAGGGAADPAALSFDAPGLALQLPLAAVRQAAERGDARAQARLGQMFARGNGVARDLREGARWTARAAEQGDAAAQAALATDYEFGFGVDKDAARGLAWRRRAAEQGDVLSELALGEALAVGDGVDQDVAASLVWLRRAAETGDPFAEMLVSETLFSRGPEFQDLAQSLAWLRRSAEHGEVEAQVRLGDAYARGLYGARDEAQAIEWYGRAVSRGSVRAAFALGGLYFVHAPDTEDDARAVDMFMHGAKLDARAQYALGVMAFSGRGGPVDRPQAIRWLTASATQGLPAARDLLGTLSLRDDPALHDPERALRWLRAAADNTPGTQTPEQRERWAVTFEPRGFAHSQRLLGKLLVSGHAKPSDVVQGWQWLWIADANGDPEAQGLMARLRPKMTGAEADEGTRRAVAWLAERPSR